jgi:hypothetical protein
MAQSLSDLAAADAVVAGTAAAATVVSEVVSLGRAGLNATGELLGPSGSVFGRTRLGGSSIFNINSNDLLRIGWGWKGGAQTGTNVFRISGQWIEQLGVKSGHIDLWTMGP